MENRPDAKQIRMQALGERGCPVCGMKGADNFKEREDSMFLPLQPRLQPGNFTPFEGVSCLNCRHLMLFGKFG